MKAGIIAEMGAPIDEGVLLQKFCDGLAGVSGSGAVPYVQANAVVESTGTVTTGAGAGGNVTTTGDVT
jgi:hypothetical protein